MTVGVREHQSAVAAVAVVVDGESGKRRKRMTGRTRRTRRTGGKMRVVIGGGGWMKCGGVDRGGVEGNVDGAGGADGGKEGGSDGGMADGGGEKERCGGKNRANWAWETPCEKKKNR